MSALSEEDVLPMMMKSGFLPERVKNFQLFATMACAGLLDENERLREQIKCGHSMELDSLARERDELAAENERLKNYFSEERDKLLGTANTIDQLTDQLINQLTATRAELAAAQAKIDSLMLEYCPDEMTPEQIENWGKHQKAVSDQTNLPLQLSP